jgi:hypothetical protein
MDMALAESILEDGITRLCIDHAADPTEIRVSHAVYDRLAAGSAGVVATLWGVRVTVTDDVDRWEVVGQAPWLDYPPPDEVRVVRVQAPA